jgi:hypothetical protein
MSATFTGPDGRPASVAIRRVIKALSTPTVGDLLAVGQGGRTAIRQRTARGIDVNGAPFAPYSTKRFYFYPNGAVGSTRRVAGTRNLNQQQVQKARATAAAGRFKKTDKIGLRTPYGIRYDGGYAEAKAAHGRQNPDLYGLQQHTHMLDTMMVKAGGVELTSAGDSLDFGSELEASENIMPATEVTLGFYGPEAARAQGNNEGTRTVPKREFFALNSQEQTVAETILGRRMEARAKEAERRG